MVSRRSADREATVLRPERLARRLWLATLLTIILAGLLGASPAAAQGECVSAPNPIVCENALPGDAPNDWQVTGAGDPTIRGFATSMSVNAGQTVSFKINTPASAYHIDILRLGYYAGNGARMIAAGLKPTAELPQSQPACLTSSATGLIDCGNWATSATWTVPSNAVSGLYIAHLTREDTGGDSQILFVVRNDASHSDLLLQTSDATWQAYNNYGGNSLYTCTVACPAGNPKTYRPAYAVSYNRPFDGALTTDSGASYLYYAEYQMIFWLEQNGYNVSYTSESQTDGKGALIKNHKAFISSGHDEYWSNGQRASVESARDAGVNLAFFTGNELFWKTRWGPSIDGSNTSYRTLTSYKETHFEGPADPQDPATWTGAWRDARASPPADGGRPENALTGQQFTVNSGTSDIAVPSKYAGLRLWRKTAAAGLGPGQTLTLSPGTGTLGYEWDEDVDNGFRPAGLFDLSSTTVGGLQSFIDYGSLLNNNATGTHHLTLYRAPSGALVFGSGTVQWSWGLSNVNGWGVGATDPSRNPPDPNMEQATVNLFADMGAQPGSLIGGLLTAEKSQDATAPSSTITSPAQNEALQDGTQLTISGTASDVGGVVAGVEVSTDGGTSWHPATMSTSAEASVSWTYAWAPHGSPTATIKSRAVDDSGNLETPSTGVLVNVSCPCSIWGTATTPPVPDSADTHSAELGVKFTSDVFGVLKGLRFYKSAANTGTHIGSLWSASGQRLATATFTNEGESGWQQVNFSTPIDIFPNTTYVASYFDPAGHYSASAYYFYSPPPTGGNLLNSPPLHALGANMPTSGGAYVSGNGLFSYSSTSTFPVNSFVGTNYWVDPVFMPAPAPGQVTNVSASSGPGSAYVTWSAPSEGGPVTTYTVTPYIGSEARPATTLTGTPPETSAVVKGLNNGTSYTFKVQASNPNGTGPLSQPSNAVVPTSLNPPTVPTAVSAKAATSQALVSWTAPASNGGSAITGYTITPYIGSSAQTPVEAGAAASSATVKGLTNGTSYTFTVTATNAIGTSPQSAASNAAVPQNAIFDFATPATIDSADTHSVVVGVKFSASSIGSVTGIRFYKAAANTGTHTGSLWSSTGTLLASATFTGESASGWQQVNFSAPVAITPNTTYVAGYLAPKGHYSDNASGFASAGVSNAPLQALANSVSANGVYTYSAGNTFPTGTFKSTNYWVDVTYAPTPVPGQVTNVSATAGPGSANVTWSAPAEGGPVTTYTVTPYIGSEAQAASTVSGAPPATGVTIKGLTPGTSYTFKVQASNANGAGPASAESNAVTPASSILPGQVTNVSATAGAGSASVTWSAPAEGGPVMTYTITPYVGSEAQPASTVNGSPPGTSATIKGLTPGTSYTFKVQASNSNGAGPVSAASNAVTPTALSAPAAPGGVTASAATSQALVSWNEPASDGGRPINGYTVTPYIGSIAQTPVEVAAGSTSTIVKGLTNGTGYTFTVIATNTIGPSPQSAASSTVVPQNTILDFATPATLDDGDSASTEVGVKFSSEVAGTVTGIRFYKAAANTGTHIGSLWSSTGTLLASATFTGESASGWQQVNFSSPVTINAYTTYVAAYLAPQGHYSSSALAFEFVTVSNPPLQALDNPITPNGVFSHSSTSAFPTGSSNATNYWVDLDFTPIPVPGQVTNVVATAGNGSASLTWSAPAEGGPVTTYTITPYIGSEPQPAITLEGSPPATGATIKGLTPGTSYTFKVQASNVNGAGPVSAESNAVTPTTVTAPGAPGNVAASAATSQALVSWSEPTNDGGSPITGYTVTPYIGSSAQTPVEAGAGATSAIVKGLANGTNYTFTVAAVNTIGTGAASTASNTVVPQNTIFDFATPASVDSGDSASTEVGVKFTSEAAGTVTGIRFYKSAGNSGTHIGSLWSSTGTLLASATFSGESGTGWQQVSFSSPVTISPNTTYVAGYLAPKGHYSANAGAFETLGVSNPPLQALASPTSANGVFSHSSTSVFPTSTSNATNYWVDLDFTPTQVPGQVTNVTATEGPGSATVSWSAPAEGGPVTTYTITPYIGSQAQPPTTLNGSPPATSTTIKGLTSGTSYTFKVQASNANGAGPASAESNAVTPTPLTAPTAPGNVAASPATGQALVSWGEPSDTGGSPVTGYTITPYIGSSAQAPVEVGAGATSAIVKGLTNGTAYSFTVAATNTIGPSPQSAASNAVVPQNTIFDFATPAAVDSGDAASTEVGVKFTSEAFGTVTGIRFYKAPANTGTHIGSLWSATGTLLASATFSGESSTGWQQVSFSSPVTISPNTTYVAGYLAPKGHYSANALAFESAGAGNPPLQALANPISPDGVFAHSVTSVFPTGTFNATNYWVDVFFSPAPAPGQVTNASATAGNASANVSWSAPAEGGPVTTYTITPYIGSEAQPPTTINGSPPATSATVKGLSNGTSYTFKVQASNPNGAGPLSAPSNAVTPTSITAPSAPTAVTAKAATSQALVSWTAPSNNGGSPITGYTITPYIGSSAQTPVEAGAGATSANVKTLTNGTSYTFTVAATSAIGTGPQSAASNTVVPQNTIFDFSTPVTLDANDLNPVVLGVKFNSEVAGQVTGIRFYKAPGNTGTHVGSLWSSAGTLLASATFSAETASGWQQVSFSSPVAINANTTYVASYLAPKGHYSASSSAFTSAGVSNPPLRALANSLSANGVYAYSSTNTFPTSSFKATNYWVDVAFR